MLHFIKMKTSAVRKTMLRKLLKLSHKLREKSLQNMFVIKDGYAKYAPPSLKKIP